MSLQKDLYQQVSYTVSEITQYLKDLLEADQNLGDLWVQGEISNLARPRSGHIYFTVKDSSAALRVVMWRSSVSNLSFNPQDGDAVKVHGHISIYEVGGQYQLYADRILPLGEGALYQAFLQIKEKLEAEGLFDDEKKKSIPSRPKLIGIVTSPTGAALRDMINTLNRRYPLVNVILAPAGVQGVDAPTEIVAAIEALNQLGGLDIIIVGRGGGSIEDLWAFNDEQVARAISVSKVPVISGIGHQTDFTIADFVADLRAPTPTAAAELAVPDRLDLLGYFEELRGRLAVTVLDRTRTQRFSMLEVLNRLERVSPISHIQRDRQRIDELFFRYFTYIHNKIRLKRNQVRGLEHQLRTLNPNAVLNRGYAIVSSPDGSIVRQVSQVTSGEKIDVMVSDGTFPAEVLVED
jgi:exodeoxyribonuclease VII large subunit